MGSASVDDYSSTQATVGAAASSVMTGVTARFIYGFQAASYFAAASGAPSTKYHPEEDLGAYHCPIIVIPPISTPLVSLNCLAAPV